MSAIPSTELRTTSTTPKHGRMQSYFYAGGRTIFWALGLIKKRGLDP